MRFLFLAAIGLGLAAAPAAALAQAAALPETSRAQSQSNALGQSIDARQRGLGQSQQNQFEVNQLRGDIQRQNALPPISPPVVCGAGARC